MRHGLSDPCTQVPHHGPPTHCGRPEGGARTWLPSLAACKHYIVIIISSSLTESDVLTDARVVGDVAHAVQVEARVKSLSPGLDVTVSGLSAHPLPGAAIHVVQVHTHLQHLHLGGETMCV